MSRFFPSLRSINSSERAINLVRPMNESVEHILLLSTVKTSKQLLSNCTFTLKVTYNASTYALLIQCIQIATFIVDFSLSFV